MHVTGRVCVDSSTKRLCRRLRKGEIAIIDHSDLDAVAAGALVDRRPRAVLNVGGFFTGRYPALGPKILQQANIILLDMIGDNALKQIKEGTIVTISQGQVRIGERVVGTGRELTAELLRAELDDARASFRTEFTRFVDNTLKRADKEKSVFANLIKPPRLKTQITGRPVVIVVRGQWYRDDLTSLLPYVREERPVLVGVDGGADALLEHGLKPDIVFGDMDSVSDRALRSARDVVVHAYHSTGRAPGSKRVSDLKLAAHTFRCPGTSEDAALLLLFEHDADLLVGVGCHRGVTDFLEKGRPGMASTLLVRMLVGSILIDANGVSRLYQPAMRWSDIVAIIMVGLLPLVAMLMQGPVTSMFVRTLLLRLRVLPY